MIGRSYKRQPRQRDHSTRDLDHTEPRIFDRGSRRSCLARYALLAALLAISVPSSSVSASAQPVQVPPAAPQPRSEAPVSPTDDAVIEGRLERLDQLVGSTA